MAKAFLTPITLPEQSAPTTPASGFGALWADSSGNLHYKNDAGTDIQLGAGGGGSLTVQDENSNVATSVTQIDFQGTGVTSTSGTGEVVVTIPGPVLPYTTTIGNGSLTTFTITHNLGTRDVFASFYNLTTYNNMIVDYERTTTNTITVNFAVAPATNNVRVLVSSNAAQQAVNPVEMGISLSDETTSIVTAAPKVTFRMPYAMTVTAVRASLTTASSTGLVTVDINEAGASILSTKLTIDATEKTSTTAATPYVLSDTALADDAEITIDIDTAGTGAKGLKIWIIGYRS